MPQQLLEQTHLVWTKQGGPCALDVRYRFSGDAIDRLPPLGRANELATPIRGIGQTFQIPTSLKVIHKVRDRLLPQSRPRSKLAQANALRGHVSKDAASVRRIDIGKAGLRQLVTELRKERLIRDAQEQPDVLHQSLAFRQNL